MISKISGRNEPLAPNGRIKGTAPEPGSGEDPPTFDWYKDDGSIVTRMTYITDSDPNTFSNPRFRDTNSDDTPDGLADINANGKFDESDGDKDLVCGVHVAPEMNILEGLHEPYIYLPHQTINYEFSTKTFTKKFIFKKGESEYKYYYLTIDPPSAGTVSPKAVSNDEDSFDFELASTTSNHINGYLKIYGTNEKFEKDGEKIISKIMVSNSIEENRTSRNNKLYALVSGISRWKHASTGRGTSLTTNEVGNILENALGFHVMRDNHLSFEDLKGYLSDHYKELKVLHLDTHGWTNGAEGVSDDNITGSGAFIGPMMFDGALTQSPLTLKKYADMKKDIIKKHPDFTKYFGLELAFFNCCRSAQEDAIVKYKNGIEPYCLYGKGCGSGIKHDVGTVWRKTLPSKVYVGWDKFPNDMGTGDEDPLPTLTSKAGVHLYHILNWDLWWRNKHISNKQALTFNENKLSRHIQNPDQYPLNKLVRSGLMQNVRSIFGPVKLYGKWYTINKVRSIDASWDNVKGEGYWYYSKKGYSGLQMKYNEKWGYEK